MTLNYPRIYGEALKSDLAKLLGVGGVTGGLWVAGFLPIAGAQKALYTSSAMVIWVG